MHLNKVEHHSLWVLKLKGGASPNVAGDTNPGAFVQVLPALDPQSLGPREPLSVHLQAVYHLHNCCGNVKPAMCSRMCSDNSTSLLSLFFTGIFGLGQCQEYGIEDTTMS